MMYRRDPRSEPARTDASGMNSILSYTVPIDRVAPWAHTALLVLVCGRPILHVHSGEGR